MVDPNEMVIVHVDDGTKRGHDRKFSRKDAESFMAYTPGAQIVGDDKPSEGEAKMVEQAPENKAVAAPRRGRAASKPEAAKDQQSSAEGAATPASGEAEGK